MLFTVFINNGTVLKGFKMAFAAYNVSKDVVVSQRKIYLINSKGFLVNETAKVTFIKAEKVGNSAAYQRQMCQTQLIGTHQTGIKPSIHFRFFSSASCNHINGKLIPDTLLFCKYFGLKRKKPRASQLFTTIW